MKGIPSFKGQADEEITKIINLSTVKNAERNIAESQTPSGAGKKIGGIRASMKPVRSNIDLNYICKSD